MRYFVLACDYDGTIATDGRVNESTLAALDRVLATGRKLILVTGRELDDLRTVFDRFELFEWVVAENGALLYRPATRQEKLLADPPPEQFVQTLHKRGVEPLSVGRAIVATWRPHETHVLEVIRDLGLELQVIFNKEAVMVLPAGINKATGLQAALHEMGLSRHNVAGIGDAENDHAFLHLCECGVAVANALPMVKETADFTTTSHHGAGVAELVDELIATDLIEREAALRRHWLLLGNRADGSEVHVKPHGTSLLIAGPSGSGKSTVATAFTERLAERQYQFCVIDPEGDYQTLDGLLAVGGKERGPTVEESLRLLSAPDSNAVINLIGLPVADRPGFFLGLFPRLQELRTRIGRPHWVIVDEAHHLLPASWQPGALMLPQALDGLVLITVHPGEVAPAILSGIDAVIAVGQSPETTLRQFCETVEENTPPVSAAAPNPGEVLMWLRRAGSEPFTLRPVPSHSERRRHVRKYAEGELPPDRSFYFRGPDGKLNLRAQNLVLFIQLAEGVDDATWTFHLQQGDYSRWFRDKIKDEALAAEAERIERRRDLTPNESRNLIKAEIEKRYTAPASSSA